MFVFTGLSWDDAQLYCNTIYDSNLAKVLTNDEITEISSVNIESKYYISSYCIT